MKTKEQLIAEQLEKPINVGDKVEIRIPYKKIETSGTGKRAKSKELHLTKTGFGIVEEIKNHPSYGMIYRVKSESFSSVPYEARLDVENSDAWHLREWINHSTLLIGLNPFKPSPRINFFSQDIGSLLSRGGYGRYDNNFMTPQYKECKGTHPNDVEYMGCTYGGINFDPYVVGANGEKQYYQRDLVWNEDQKKLLIESIFNGIEIGKFLFRYKSWNHIVSQMKESGHGFNFDCVDGKQRFHAILEFVQNKFPSTEGFYFRELSELAQRKFFGYDKLTLGEMTENTTDKEVIAGFLHLNFTGTPMSEEHIRHVQKIQI